MAEYATIDNLNRFLTKIVEKFAKKIHTHTKDQVGLSNVENKSGATIRSEMTKAEVTKALTYTPVPPTNIVDPNLATVSGFAADALATKNQLSELNRNIGIFQYKERDTGGIVQPGSWYKIPNFSIDLGTGVYTISFWIRSQGGGSMNTNYNTPFSINVGLSESTSYNDDAIAGCLNKHWSVSSCSRILKLDSPKKYNLFLKHDAKESHKIDFRIDIVKIR